MKWYATYDNSTKTSELYHDNWNNVKNKILGRSGLKYKGFEKELLAREWLSQFNSNDQNFHSTNDQFLSIDDFHQVIYTDGSYLSKTGKAGWAYVLTSNNQYKAHNCGQVDDLICDGTNNRGELMAILKALEENNNQSILIYSDSRYSINSLTIWVEKWRKNKWITSQGTPVKNQDLIRRILELKKNRNIVFRHIDAHQGHYFNEMADKLAKSMTC